MIARSSKVFIFSRKDTLTAITRTGTIRTENLTAYANRVIIFNNGAAIFARDSTFKTDRIAARRFLKHPIGWSRHRTIRTSAIVGWFGRDHHLCWHRHNVSPDRGVNE